MTPVGDKVRPRWAEASELLRAYYDTEWGVPVTDERGVFERLTLEAFQSGLSWSTILHKRDAFRRAFAGFDPDAVAQFTKDDIARCMADASIVRNRRKILATIGNARASVAARDAVPLHELVWQHVPTVRTGFTNEQSVPTQSPESVALSQTLKRWGFTFVGPVTCYALFCAIGLVNAHPVGTWRYETVEQLQLDARRHFVR
ncbi:DNA-3-methyladenine glycosylase I [Gulosibacter bifidus]|uniref:DNA-3-methyladenine glycosylase I n=1 Tax=Gulosibacter bifidus TaxID=272239 RepID=A0ABW5RGT8_9MICO|nr:DNA-3-methyladenine glycosylase I [Gulosibacter bifidus]